MTASTVERLREILHYCSESGVFTWKAKSSRYSSVKAGNIAGSIDKDGYVRICVDGKFYKAHRLAWLYMNGEWPANKVDHINGIPSDNRWSNLRAATHAENMRNVKIYINNSSGFKGVSFHKKTGKWQARIRLNNVLFSLGFHSTPEIAAVCYEGAAAILFGLWRRTDAATAAAKAFGSIPHDLLDIAAAEGESLSAIKH